MPGKVLALLHVEGRDPLRLLLKSDMICRLGNPEPPHWSGRVPEILLLAMVRSLQEFPRSHQVGSKQNMHNRFQSQT